MKPTMSATDFFIVFVQNYKMFSEALSDVKKEKRDFSEFYELRFFLVMQKLILLHFVQ